MHIHTDEQFATEVPNLEELSVSGHALTGIGNLPAVCLRSHTNTLTHTNRLTYMNTKKHKDTHTQTRTHTHTHNTGAAVFERAL